MKTYTLDIIPKIQRYSKKLDDLTILMNQHWIVFDDEFKSKNVYIFRPNNVLLISSNGHVEKAHWEYLGFDSLLIDREKESYLFRHGFFNDSVMALKLDSSEEYAILVNEHKTQQKLDSLQHVIEYLEKNYMEDNVKTEIPSMLYKNPAKANETNEVFEFMLILLVLFGFCVAAAFIHSYF